MATMNTGLGGPAGYGENVFSSSPKAAGDNDDGSVAINVTSVFGPSGIEFFGSNYTTIYLNTNGTISFGTPFTDYDTNNLAAETTPMLAPFFSDVNIGSGGEIYWDIDTSAGTITMTWDGVAPYSGGGSNSFQVVITETGGGDYTVEYIYEDIQWTDGGNGGDHADVGLTDGGANDIILDGSANESELANYETNDFGNGDPVGTWTQDFSGGVPSVAPDPVDGSAGSESMTLGYTDGQGDQITSGDDEVYGNGGDDTIDANNGDDTIYGGTGNDSIGSYGGEYGNDLIYGDAGNDTIIGGAGRDTIYGGVGNDALTGAVGDDSIFGEDGNDSISITDDHDTDTIDGGAGTDAISFANWTTTEGVSVEATGDESGTYDFFGAGATGQGEYTEIEALYGTDYADRIDLRESSANQEAGGNAGDDTILGGTGNDVLLGLSGNDSIHGGGGADTIDGGTGDDTITGGQTTANADLNLSWISEGASGTDIAGGFTQDTGGINVAVSFTNDGNADFFQTSNATQYVNTGGGETYAANSALYLAGGATTGDTSTTTIDFSAADDSGFQNSVQDVSFRINDLDQSGWEDIITIRAYDAAGNLLTTTLTYQGATTTGTSPTEDGEGSYNQNDAAGSMLVEISGEVSYFEIDYDQAGTAGQALWVTDIHFTAIGQTDTGDSITGGTGEDLIYGYDGNDTVFGEDGNDSIEAGTGDDSIDGGAGNDTIFGGVGNDSIMGGSGDDSISGGRPAVDSIPGSAADTIWGGSGNDSIKGNQGNDSLLGGTGNDTVQGGAGEDTIVGNEGADVLIGGDDDDVLFGGIDTAADEMDGGSGADAFFLENGFGNDTIIGGELGNDSDSINGSLLTDSVTVLFNGDESGAVTDGTYTANFIEIENIITGSGNDSVNASADSTGVGILTGAGNDTILGGTGDDTIYGEGGADQIEGGAGNDYIEVGGGSDRDTIVLADGSGSDTVAGFDMTDSGDGTTIDQLDVSGLTDGSGNPVNVADVTVTDTNGDGTGNAILTFPNGESITLIGVLSSQVDSFAELEGIGIPPVGPVDGTAGDDFMNVGYTDAQGDIIDGADGLNDTIYGYAGNDEIIAGAGDDTVDGGTGRSTIYGGDGSDVLSGSGGRYYGEAGNDTIDVSGATSGEGLFYVYSSPGTGNDSVIGGDLTDDYIHIQSGDDTVDGGLDGGAEGDWLNFDNTGSAVSVDLVAGSATYTGGTVSLSDIEHIDTGDFNDTISGSDEANFIESGGGNDSIVSLGGADEVRAGDGDDTVFAGDGDDEVYGGTGNDSIDMGNQNDLGYGDAGNDTLDGGVGSDTLYGGTGDDLVQGGGNTGNPDEVYGGAGNDTVIGGNGAGHDSLFGDDGNDELRGQQGDDTIWGGSGDDTIVLEDDFGNDVITGGETGETAFFADTLDLTEMTSGVTVDTSAVDPNDKESGTVSNGTATATFTEIENLVLTNYNDTFIGSEGDDGYYTVSEVYLNGGNDYAEANGGDDRIFAGDGNDTILTGAGDDYIEAEAGRDLVYGEAGNDALDGGAGDDTLYGDIGDDWLGGAAGNDSMFGGAGNDLLSAGTGEDTLVGGAGNDSINLWGDSDRDTVVLADGSGDDTVSYFDMTDSGDGTTIDQLDVSALTSDGGTTPVTTNDVTVTDDGSGNAVLTFPGGESITLIGVAPAQVDSMAELVSIGIPSGLDYIVEGTAAGDIMTAASYTGDPEGDRIDNNDALDGSNDDVIYGYGGNDIIDAGNGENTVYGGDGNDQIYGGSNADSIEGEAGDDSLYSGLGNDTILGGDGNDSIFASTGNDSIDAGAGNDTIRFTEDDTVLGGDGDDRFQADALVLDGSPVLITGGEGGETTGDTLSSGTYFDDVTVDLTANGTGADPESGTMQLGTTTVTFSEIENIETGSGNDSIIGSSGDDHVSTGDGDDTLIGGAGNDSLSGGGDQDDFIITDGFGDDTIDGGSTGTDFDEIDASAVTSDLTVTFSDAEDGTIAGGGDTITFTDVEILTLGSGNDSVTGGTGNENIQLGIGDDYAEGGAGNDSLYGDLGEDTLLGGAGNDTLSGNSSNDSIEGGDGDDRLDGGSGDDILRGDAGNDTVSGFAGADTLDGGAGNDSIDAGSDGDRDVIVLQDSSGDDTVSNFDMTDFGDGTTIDQLDVSGLTDGSGNPVNVADVTVTDTNGNGTGDAILTFPNGESITLVGVLSSQVDSFAELEAIGIPAVGPVDGTAGDDVMNVGYTDAQGDIIDGTDGLNDTINGDAGNDNIDAGLGDDTVSAGSGNDTVTGGSGDDWVSGNSGEDIVFGGAGNDSVYGAEGNDVMYGEAGNDSMEGWHGNDTIDGGLGDDYIDGADDDDSLIGGDGNDTLLGGNNGGEDTLDGGDGNDSMLAGDANDSLLGGAGDDAQFGEGGDDTFIITDNFGDDSITGGETGETTGDILDASGATTDLALNLSANGIGDPESGTLSDGTSTATFTQIETVVLGSGNDQILGSTGDDSVDGGAGDDTFAGGAGNDTLAGGDDNDLFIISDGFGDDSIIGGEGGTNVDTLDLSGLTGPVTISFNGDKSGTVTDGLGNTITFSEIERIITTDADDDVTITGDSAGVEIWAGADNDTVTGGAGNDTIYGFDGDDSISGAAGNDTLDGDAGNDSITGDAGNDTLIGDSGTDTLIGGDGSDVIFGGGDDDDIVLGGSDMGFGGDGDDVFSFDSSDTNTSDITVVGGEADEGGADTSNDNFPFAPNTTGDVLDLSGLNIVDITFNGADPTGESGTVTYLNDGGQPVTINFSEIENVVVCFARDTLIRTIRGEVAIQDLKSGDKVLTRDNGYQKISWIGSTTVPAYGKLAPITITAGTLGNHTDLTVSPNHRMLIEGWRAELIKGQSEVLAAAKHLVNGETIYVKSGGEVEYFHMLFEQHEIVFANGAASESFHPGEVGLTAIEQEMRDEIFSLFPELRDDVTTYGPTARSIAKAHEAQLLI